MSDCECGRPDCDYAWCGLPLCPHGYQFDCEHCQNGTVKEKPEPKYCSIDFVFKETPDHNVDTVMELLENWLPDCTPPVLASLDDEDVCDCEFYFNGEPHIHAVEEDGECACGMISMGGCGHSSLDKIWDHQRFSDRWAFDVLAEDLKQALYVLDNHTQIQLDPEAYERLRKAAYWHDDFQAWLDSLPDEEE